MAPLPQHGSAIDQCVAVDVVQKGASKIKPGKYGSQNHHNHPKIHHYN